MTAVPVLWVSRHPEILSRGYHDQAVLEAILDRSLWRPPGAIAFDHYEVRDEEWFIDPPESGVRLVPPVGVVGKPVGGVVVIPSRHHVDDVDWICAQLDRMPWSVVLLTSEEEWGFDWRRIMHIGEDDEAEVYAKRRLWVWQGLPEHAEAGAFYMPCGWYPGAREDIRAAVREARDRPLDLFAGFQVTHSRREECKAAMENIAHIGRRKGATVYTEGYLQGLPYDQYLRMMTSAKVIPCPSGPVSLCTARVEEALEAGCVPVTDLVTPDPDARRFDYWEMVFPGHPWPSITDWGELPVVLEEVLSRWPSLSVSCSAYWAQWKRSAARRLDADIRAVSGSA